MFERGWFVSLFVCLSVCMNSILSTECDRTPCQQLTPDWVIKKYILGAREKAQQLRFRKYLIQSFKTHLSKLEINVMAALAEETVSGNGSGKS